MITKVTGPDGKTVQYGYDGDGDLVSVTDQLGKVSTLRYLADHYLDQVTGPDGRCWRDSSTPTGASSR